MTDAEIIKALECCADDSVIRCEECLYGVSIFSCRQMQLKKDSLDLINRQKTKNNQLDETIQQLAEEINRQKAEVENQSENFKVLISDHMTLQHDFDNLKGLYEAEKAKVEKAKEKSIYFAKELQTAKAELKEATEKFNCQQYVYADLSDIIKEKNAEIERLKEQDETAEKIIREQGGTILHLKDENSRLFDRNCELSEKGEKAVIACIATRNEAIKEFAEELKRKGFVDEYYEHEALVYVADIENLVKEMVGDTE